MKSMLASSLAVLLVLSSTGLTGCSTVGGAVKGAGQDLSRAGEWIQNR